LAGSKLDDANVGEAAGDKWILLDNRLNVFSAVAHRQDDPSIARNLAT
jgi:hypothetical protein